MPEPQPFPELPRSGLSDASHCMQQLMISLDQCQQAQTRAKLPDSEELVRSALAPVNERLRQQMASLVDGIPTFSVPRIDLPGPKDLLPNSVVGELLKQVSAWRSQMLEHIRASLRPLFGSNAIQGIDRVLLPPNLRDYADKVQALDVYKLLEEEGIPLYLVPRGRTALRILRAEDRSARRKVLGDCYWLLIDDCEAVLERADHEAVRDEVGFALDGLGAMRSGYTRSAQAVFTVSLDTLIYRFYPDRASRRVITNRGKGAGVPDVFDQMNVRDALVWLPIWNAHEQFWKHNGDKVPHYYSRHASVHGVSPRQFNKRNCVQVLMLLTSLIGYADRIVREVE